MLIPVITQSSLVSLLLLLVTTVGGFLGHSLFLLSDGLLLLLGATFGGGIIF